jgi:small subunit ribosomal protein S9
LTESDDTERDTPNEPGQPDAPAEEPTAPEPPAEEPTAPEPAEEPVSPEPVEEPTAPEPPVEEPVAEQIPAEEPLAEQDEPMASTGAEAPAEETPIDEAPIEEPAETPVAEQPTEAEQPIEPAADAEQAQPESPAAEAAAAEPKAKDVVPGANLEPISITEERELTAEERARLEAEEEERLSREAAAQGDDDEELPRRAAVAVPTDASIQATGKRKSSVARVLLRSGGGAFEINGKGLEEYFPRPHHQSMARQPLITAGYDGNVDVRIRVHGGGISGQAGAVRHGIARALVELDPELRGDLKKRGLLTRDAREKERRKAGLKKARKRPQFSKR